MIWENCTEICIISYMKQIASLGSMYDTGCLGLVHWDDPEGRYGEEGGRGIHMGNICIPVADSCWGMAKPIQYCKVLRKKVDLKLIWGFEGISKRFCTLVICFYLLISNMLVSSFSISSSAFGVATIYVYVCHSHRWIIICK